MGKSRWDSIEIPGHDSCINGKCSPDDVETKTTSVASSQELPRISYQSPSFKTNHVISQPQIVRSRISHRQKSKPDFRTAFFLAVCALLAVIVISSSFALIKFFSSPLGGGVAVFITLILFLVMRKKGNFPL
jgi:hypothetical protein